MAISGVLLVGLSYGERFFSKREADNVSLLYIVTKNTNYILKYEQDNELDWNDDSGFESGFEYEPSGPTFRSLSNVFEDDIVNNRYFMNSLI